MGLGNDEGDPSIVLDAGHQGNSGTEFSPSTFAPRPSICLDAEQRDYSGTGFLGGDNAGHGTPCPYKPGKKDRVSRGVNGGSVWEYA
jgi:hypothetical protein